MSHVASAHSPLMQCMRRHLTVAMSHRLQHAHCLRAAAVIELARRGREGQHGSVRSAGESQKATENSQLAQNAKKLQPSLAGHEIGQPAANIATFRDHERRSTFLAPACTRPLHNRRIVVTAPRQYASKLCGLLTTAGARSLWLPGIQVCALEAEHAVEALDAALADLSKYSHIAFTSRNGIYAVMARLFEMYGNRARDVVHSSGVRLCALGADANALRELGLEVHVVPKEASTQGLVAELRERDEANGACILCPVPCVSGGLTEPPVVPRFLAGLSDAGAEAVRIDAYTTQPGLSAEDIAAEAALMSGGCVDAIVFTSTAEAEGLMNALGGGDALAQLVAERGIILAAHGPYTAAGVSATIGMDVDVIGSSFGSFHGVVSALEEYYSAQRG